MSRKLINYIVDELILIDNDDVIKLIVNNKCGLDDNCLTVLKTGLEMEYQKNLKKCKRTNIK